MKSSSYLNWFRRLVVLGAVVAVGAFASTAGAVGRPPDIQDATASLAANVSRPPDIGRRARLSASVPDVFERYAAAHPFGSASVPDVFERYAATHPSAVGCPCTTRPSAGRPTSVMRPPRPNSRSPTSSSGTPPSIPTVGA